MYEPEKSIQLAYRGDQARTYVLYVYYARAGQRIYIYTYIKKIWINKIKKKSPSPPQYIDECCSVLRATESTYVQTMFFRNRVLAGTCNSCKGRGEGETDSERDVCLRSYLYPRAGAYSPCRARVIYFSG